MGHVSKAVRKMLTSALPKNKLGDKVFSYIEFLRTQKRLPTSKILFNDVLFKIKTGNEIDNPLRVFTSDKEFIKLFVKAVVGNKHNVETIGIINTKDQVDSFGFPGRCCIKPTHASGEVIIRKNGEPLDHSKMKKWFDICYYTGMRERNYKPLLPKIIVEPLIFDIDNPEDYKFFCYQGKVKMIQVDFDRHSNHTRKLYDPNWKPLNFSLNYPISVKSAEKPACLHAMLNVCEKLSSYFSFVRIDLYTNGEDFFVGEITHCHGSASERFIPSDYEESASTLLFETK